MAVFKVPRISSQQRGTLILEPSEVVYDVDEQSFYGGNGSDRGGFPIGQGSSGSTFSYQLSQNDIDNGFISLPRSPFLSSSVRLNIVGGIEQINGVDFLVSGSVLSWGGLGLDNFLETGETLIINY